MRAVARHKASSSTAATGTCRTIEVSRKKIDMELLYECGKGARFQIAEVIGRGRRGLVRAAVDTHTGERVAIKKISDIFEHVSDAIRILREIKLLRLLRHPDIVEIKHIILPSSPTDFKDIFIVFELMESDLHQVIMDNEDLTQEHHRFFLYQLLRALKYLHTANVIHRDLKPKNILANADCKLKIDNFNLSRASFSDASSSIFWNVCDVLMMLCSFSYPFIKLSYTPEIDIWSIGCVFAEMLTRKPLFPGKNMLHHMDLITNLLGTPSAESIAGVRNANARKYLSGMQKKKPVPFSQKFPGLDPLGVSLLERLLAFDPNCRPSAKEALADPYFHGLANVDHEPTAQPISKVHFEFEKRKLTKEDVRELIYREVERI
ncbi:unnamed protein product [Spirodela intermedia]|uniref:Protein kinase domain-containing protein n=1 Tax=Spirodela intermedia TaxID=51605 RepID=A0A7I8JMN9_SPIIN|nr:unnamed protein product [Spirodela intermedia]CAA6671418.1 unnamed protein product [Spirodela intermedia]